MKRLMIWCPILCALLLAGALLAAYLPIGYRSTEEVFEIPQGTWAQRMTGDTSVNILPNTVYLALGVRNVLVLKNMDDVPQIFGPTLIMPGQSFKLPFDLAAEYQFECTAHASGQMTVIVDEEPHPGCRRLRWRIKQLLRKVQSL